MVLISFLFPEFLFSLSQKIEKDDDDIVLSTSLSFTATLDGLQSPLKIIQVRYPMFFLQELCFSMILLLCENGKLT